MNNFKLPNHDEYEAAHSEGVSHRELGLRFFGEYGDTKRASERYAESHSLPYRRDGRTLKERLSLPSGGYDLERGDSPVRYPAPAGFSEVRSSGSKIEIPKPNIADSTDWLKLNGNFGLLADVHCPKYDDRVIQAAVQTTLDFGIREMIWLGDTFDCHQWHGRFGQARSKRKFQDDLQLGEKLIEAVLKHIDRLYIFKGNHDGWFEAAMKGQIDYTWHMGKLFGQFGDRVVWSEYEQCQVWSGDKEWRMVHGANYSAANPLGVAQALCSKFQSNVCMGHQHHACSGLDLSRRYQAVCLGCAADPNKLDYLHKSPRRNPEQTQGFGVLYEGYVHDFKQNHPRLQA